MGLTCMMLLAALCCWAQQVVVSGTVVDADTRRPIAGASVSFFPSHQGEGSGEGSGTVSVVTNEDGFFTLKTSRKAEVLFVSHLGYRSQRISLTSETQQPLKVMMRQAAVELDEVLVMSANARDLVMSAIRNIPDNYSKQPEIHHCFYREKVMKRQNYINVAEGVIDMYKSAYESPLYRDRAAIRKGRRLLSPRQRDTLSVKVMGGPTTALILDVVKNREFLLNAQELSLYELQMEWPTTIADRRQYVVSLTPRERTPYALYFGRLYIDQETLAFTRVELQLDMSNREKATNQMLVKKPRGLRFKPKELSCVVDYRKGHDSLMHVAYIRNTFRFNCDWKRRLFATSFTAVCEMAVTSTTNRDVLPIRGRDSFDQRDAFFDKVDFFRDSTFWQDYNIIEPTESLDKAVNKLLKSSF